LLYEISNKEQTSSIFNVVRSGTGSTQPREDNWVGLDREVANLIKRVDINILLG
jgi:hypothetical protein